MVELTISGLGDHNVVKWSAGAYPVTANPGSGHGGEGDIFYFSDSYGPADSVDGASGGSVGAGGGIYHTGDTITIQFLMTIEYEDANDTSATWLIYTAKVEMLTTGEIPNVSISAIQPDAWESDLDDVITALENGVNVKYDDPASDGRDVDATFSINLSGPALPFSVPVALDTPAGSAVFNTDYRYGSGEFAGFVVIPAGQTAKQFAVSTIDDDAVEGTETFSLSIKASTTYVATGSAAVGSIQEIARYRQMPWQLDHEPPPALTYSETGNDGVVYQVTEQYLPANTLPFALESENPNYGQAATYLGSLSYAESVAAGFDIGIASRFTLIGSFSVTGQQQFTTNFSATYPGGTPDPNSRYKIELRLKYVTISDGNAVVHNGYVLPSGNVGYVGYKATRVLIG